MDFCHYFRNFFSCGLFGHDDIGISGKTALFRSSHGVSCRHWFLDDHGAISEKQAQRKTLPIGGKEYGDIFLNPENADLDNSKHIDFKEATFLGVALSINNIGGGLSAGMIGLNSLLVGFLSAVLSFVALWAGNYIAEFFIRKNISGKMTVAGGLLLIAIGIEQLF